MPGIEPGVIGGPAGALVYFAGACVVGMASAAALLAVFLSRLRSAFRKEVLGELRTGLTEDLRLRLAGDIGDKLAAEMRSSRRELAEDVARGQSQLGEQLHRALGDVHVSLGEADRKWNEVKTLGESVSRLRDIFENPARRGRILGEITLERLLRDCLPPGYFAFQQPIGGQRVDAVVKFPHAGVMIPIDSKFPASTDAAQFATALLRMARDVAGKYIRPDLGTTPFAYLYLPSESLWQEATQSPRVWEELAALKVYPVSPQTLAIALHAVAHGVTYFERGLHAQETLEALEARRRQIQKLSEETADAMALAQKAVTTLSKVGRELEALSSLLTSGAAAGASRQASSVALGGTAPVSEPVSVPRAGLCSEPRPASGSESGAASGSEAS